MMNSDYYTYSDDDKGTVGSPTEGFERISPSEMEAFFDTKTTPRPAMMYDPSAEWNVGDDDYMNVWEGIRTKTPPAKIRKQIIYQPPLPEKWKIFVNGVNFEPPAMTFPTEDAALVHIRTWLSSLGMPIADVGTTYYDYRIQRYVERPRSGAGLSRVVYNNGAMSIILRMVD